MARMRAKTINEANNFTRGMNPKAAMGIGGINLHDERQRRLEDFDNKIEKVKDKANKEWQNRLQNLFVGKTITAFMQKLASFDKNTMKQRNRSETKNFTIKVADVMCEKIDDMSSCIIADTDHNVYSIKFHIDQIIHID